MTSPKIALPPDAWRIGGAPGGAWLRAHRRDLVSAALAGLREETDPGRERDPQLRWIVQVNVDLFIRALEDPDFAVDEATAADLVASATRRASEGSPIEALIQDYMAGSAALWRSIATRIQPEEMAGLLQLTDFTFTHLREVMALLVRGFEHEAAAISMGERDARFAVFSALLNGSRPEQAALRSGISLPDRYLVLSLRLAAGAVHDSQVAGRALIVEEHRRVNTVRRVLAEHAHGPVLALLRGPSGTALVPLPTMPAIDEFDQIRAMLRKLTTAVGCDVHAGAAIATPDEVATAITQTEEIVELVVALGRPAGAWFLEDILVPYQLTRPGPAREHLAERMRLLDDHPDWEQTLRTYLACGFDRRRTADTLHVHPNTVDYRLSRIADGCGFDAADPAQRPVTFAALCVRDLENAASR